LVWFDLEKALILLKILREGYAGTEMASPMQGGPSSAVHAIVWILAIISNQNDIIKNSRKVQLCLIPPVMTLLKRELISAWILT